MGSYEKLLAQYDDEIIIEETNLKKRPFGSVFR